MTATTDDYLGALAELVAERRKPTEGLSDFAIGYNAALREVGWIIGAAMRVASDGPAIEMDHTVAARVTELAGLRQASEVSP